MKSIVIAILLSVLVPAADLGLKWNPNPVEDAIVLYEVSFHTGPGTPVVTLPTSTVRITIPALIPGTMYYFTVVAVNAEGLKSEPSDVLIYRIPKTIAKPTELQVVEDEPIPD
jgi:hypothetical protein